MHFVSKARTLAFVGLLAVSLVLVSCGGSSGGEQTVPSQPAQSPFSGGITTSPANPVTTATTGTPSGPTSAEISPQEVAVGNFVMTMVIEPAQHMFDSGKQASDDSAADDKKKQDQTNGIAVLGGMMLKTTNNMDAAQNPKDESPQGEVLRHVAIQIKDKASGQIVPYLSVSMDALRDGRPAFSDQALVPEIPNQKDISQLRFGNNVRFPKKGTYQLFVRVEANPILGTEVPPAAQFNLTFK